jgi:16S rRNA (uracil1498-N3)-methyltransferase
MKRAFADRNIWQEKESELSAEESHHLLRVLRAQAGETIEIFDGRGKKALAELVSARKNIAFIKIVPESVRCVMPHMPAFILFQAVPKHSGMEAIVQKATELGVQKIVPVMTGRVIVKLNNSTAAQRVERWRKIVLASVKQCRSAWLPEVCPIVPLAEAVAGIKSDLQIFGGLVPQTPVFREILRQVDHSAVKSITLVIGPEGDLTEEEQQLLVKANFKPVSFGTEVLRVETAAIFGLSALNYEFPRCPDIELYSVSDN